MVDPSVLAALSVALETDPGNLGLRRHLVTLLIDDQQFAEAFALAGAGLAQAPDDVELIEAVVRAGRALGRDVSGYERILHALRPGATPAEPERAVPLRAGAVVPDSADALIAEWESSGAAPEIGTFSRPGTRLDDVGGLQDVKDRIRRSFLGPISRPDLELAYGKAAGGGLLLWGPPGCGKTYIARALAGELGASFYEVGLSDVLDMWVGSSERNLHEVFEFARRNTPCVVFFDELDALGLKRTQLRGGGSAMRGVVNQLLAEMDGAVTNNRGVFFLGATNHPWDIDPALLRPGRFDRSILVLPPDQPAREAILRTHLADRPQANLPIDRLAKATDGLTGADLRMICDEATDIAIQRSIDQGDVQPITSDILQAAAKGVRSSIGPWMESARNVAMFGNADGRYDELLAFIKRWKY